jgi:hypothetical protein
MRLAPIVFSGSGGGGGGCCCRQSLLRSGERKIPLKREGHSRAPTLIVLAGGGCLGLSLINLDSEA